MAIGSQGEYGKVFGLWKDMDEQTRMEWFKYMEENWVPLMKGYATLVHNKKNNPFYE